ncbi:MAG TPA: hypothetical protein VFK78_09860 [Gemmatimonadales bacterium]|nr:hypothetical protein [Gemmatimonadales bacterium]
MALKGRHWLMLWLLAFLLAAAAVIARQTAGLGLAKQLRDLRASEAALQGRRAELARRIRADQSREVLVPRARKLGLRLPADTELVLLPQPARVR